MTDKVDVVVVTYQSAHVLKECLASLPRCANIYVVDNASTDGSVAVATEAGAEVIRLSENVGYGAACNAGAAVGTSAFLLFLNPDVRLANGAIDNLLAAAADYPCAAFNPSFYNEGRRRFRRWSRLFPGVPPWRGQPPIADCQVPVLHGACIFVRRDHFACVRGFDEHIFLYHEDDDISLRLSCAGVELRTAVEAVVDHAEGRSSIPSGESSRIRGEAMGRSLVYVMRKHHLALDIQAERRRGWFKLLLPHVLFNTARRSKLLGFLAGIGGQQQVRIADSVNRGTGECDSAIVGQWNADSGHTVANCHRP